MLNVAGPQSIHPGQEVVLDDKQGGINAFQLPREALLIQSQETRTFFFFFFDSKKLNCKQNESKSRFIIYRHFGIAQLALFDPNVS